MDGRDLPALVSVVAPLLAMVCITLLGFAFVRAAEDANAARLVVTAAFGAISGLGGYQYAKYADED